MSADNEKIIDIQFDNAPQTIDITFDNDAQVLEADFGNVQQITVGNVSVRLEETDEGVVITAWDAEGEETAFVRHGKDGYTPVKGVDYFDGKDGYTPVKGVDYFDGKDGYTPVKGVDYFDGKQGDPGYTPVKGVDYYTAADKAEMVAAVLAALPEAGIGGGITFETDETLKLENGILSVNTAKEVGKDNTLPVTSAAVYNVLANINTPLTEITWSELKALRDNAQLKAGHYYRITDYVATTVQANTQSAGHPFDIVVMAVTEKDLETKAFALLHEGDIYFANSDMAAWELLYSLDNDTNRFAWADEVNGKGVVFRMIDENNNKCPYDFKGIQMRDALDTANETYYYTFDTQGADLSLDGSQCYNNEMKEYVDGTQRINRIIFRSDHHKNITDNYFDILCYNNTFEGACRSLRFERECYGNKFGYGCTTSTFETKFRNNRVGGEVQSITVGKGASDNVFGSNIYYSTFGTYFRKNVVCKYMYYSSFGHYVQNCILGDSAEAPGQYMRFLTFENNVQYVNLFKTDKTTKTYMENVKICSGTVGKSASRIMIEVSELAQKYAITYANNSAGELVKYCDADGGNVDVDEIAQAVIDKLPVYAGEVADA